MFRRFEVRAHWPTQYRWGLSRKRRNHLTHALHGNGRGGRGAGRGASSDPSSGWQQVGRAGRVRPEAPASSLRPGRAQVAGRAALKGELEAAGFSVVTPLREGELLHLHRRRLLPDERLAVLAAVNATHIVGDDPLCPGEGRGGPLCADLWKVAPKFAWGDAHRGVPLVELPEHFTRLKERVEWELHHCEFTEAVAVLVTVPRTVVDSASDWDSFATLADPTLLSGWGSGCGVSAVVAFAAPLKVLRFPSDSAVVPPVRWDESTLPLRSAAAVLLVTRRAADAPAPTYSKRGSFSSWKELQARDREGVARIVVELDVVQRLRQGGQTLQVYGRRALSELLGAAVPQAHAPPLPLQGLTVQGDIVSGFVDLPVEWATQAVAASGRVRGVFARPWLSSSGPALGPPSFSLASHRVIWASMARFSDGVFQALTEAKVPFTGLVCAGARGQVGVRVVAGSDSGPVQKCLEDAGAARVRVPERRRCVLRASGIPVAFVGKLHLVVARLDPDVRLVDTRVVRSTFGSLVVDFTVEGKALSGDSWHIQGLGSRPVIVQRHLRRQPPVPATRMPPSSVVPAPRKPLTLAEQVSWASVTRPSPSVGGPGSHPSSRVQVTPGVSGSPAPSVVPPVSASVGSPVLSDDAEIPDRRRPVVSGRVRIPRKMSC